MVKRVSLKVTYRRGRPIAAYVYLPRQAGDRVATTEQFDAAVLVDRASDGRAIGIEGLSQNLWVTTGSEEGVPRTSGTPCPPQCLVSPA